LSYTSEEAAVNSAIELALIVIAVSSPFLIAVFMKHYFSYKADAAQKLAELDLKAAASDNEALRKTVAELKARVEVLEAIVTDDGYSLRKKIANL
jgi:cell division protein FtsB